MNEAVERHAGLDAVMARAPSENFPVALRMLPRAVQGHLRAIYGYARLVDTLGDEYPGDRLAALDWVEAQLDDLFAGAPRHEAFVRLAPTVERFGLGRDPFDGLLAANRLDQHKTAYADFDELMGYCELSASPVGRLVLAVFEAATPDRLRASDQVCSGLQVLEHLQDVGEDAANGRVYLPADDMERFGVCVEDLGAPAASANLRGLVAYEASRARSMLDQGRGLAASLRGPARLAVAGFVAGGLANLDALEAARYEVLGAPRKAGAARVLGRLAGVYSHRERRRRAKPGAARARGRIAGMRLSRVSLSGAARRGAVSR
ncbi:MAG: squalene synthase HpnC [Acidimicrobiaceae bacterium]|nr:squalene synthase HpnC [Acidimicrobiaceae bacterium]